MKKIICAFSLLLVLMGANSQEHELQNPLVIGFENIGWYPQVSEDILLELQDYLAMMGGDDAGNGGFAYEQSSKLLVIAAVELQELVRTTDFPLIENFPDRREILRSVFRLQNIIQLPNVDDIFRNGKRLALDYKDTTPFAIKLYRPFYQRFMGILTDDIFDAVKEVKKLFLHEAAHIWGFNESASRAFAISFLEHVGIKPIETSLHPPHLKESHCVCQNSQSVLMGPSCSDFCSQQPASSVPILFIEASLNDNDAINPAINDIYDWCTYDEMGSCYLRVTDGTINSDLPISISKGNGFRQIESGVSSLEWGKVYLAYLHNNRGVSSDYIHIQLIEHELEVEPIETMSISRYRCLSAGGWSYTDPALGTSEIMLNKVAKVSQYYDELHYPQAIPEHTIGLTCHDRLLYGDIDNIFYPRLHLMKDVFKVFDPRDSTFVDGTLQTELGYVGWIGAIPFSSFKTYSLFGSSYTTSVDGLILDPIRKTQKGLPEYFCPSAEHFASSDPVMKVLWRYLQVETEALYLGLRVAVTSTNTSLPTDHIYVREGNLKRVRFHLIDGKAKDVTPISATKKQVFFYWPVNINDPYVHHPGQDLYLVSNDKPGIPDKRIGCVPKMMEGSGIIDTSVTNPIGANCSSDYQCDSLCCNEGSGTCAPHDPSQGFFCAKPVGTQCITTDYCAETVTPVCGYYKVGLDGDGNQICDIRCFYELTGVQCLNGYCKIQEQTYDVQIPELCEDAPEYPSK